MTEIPSERAARTAWAALPESVRRDARRQAERGEAATDPAVAAVIAGLLRDRKPARSWLRRAMVRLPIAAILGLLIALQYFGILSLNSVIDTSGLVVFGVFVTAVVTAVLVQVVRWLAGRRKPSDDGPPPATAEVPNLRKVIQSAPVQLAQPLVVHGEPRVRKALLTIGLIALSSVGFVMLLTAIRPGSGDVHRLLSVHFTIAFGAGAVAAWASWGRHLRRLPIRLDDRGVRFGFAPVIPWSDVLGVSLVGPSPGDDHTKPALIWTLRAQDEIRLELDVLSLPPEQIVLAARAYKLAH
ncbi:MAG: hypothetical protein HOV71_01475 [Hamadaea sp.]|nr:hypothetical protein [Hamadaea sp.]NUR46781.1 hypothetical protein [Hamadaea sp.]NUT06012.1 hypothetical protein [Hamadaea sp.]